MAGRPGLSALSSGLYRAPLPPSSSVHSLPVSMAGRGRAHPGLRGGGIVGGVGVVGRGQQPFYMNGYQFQSHYQVSTGARYYDVMRYFRVDVSDPHKLLLKLRVKCPHHLSFVYFIVNHDS